MTENTNETIIENTETTEQTSDKTIGDSFARRRNKAFWTLLKTFFDMANLAGFRIESRIRIRDVKTGKIYE